MSKHPIIADLDADSPLAQAMILADASAAAAIDVHVEFGHRPKLTGEDIVDFRILVRQIWPEMSIDDVSRVAARFIAEGDKITAKLSAG